MRYGVAIDLGTSSYRAQKINLDTREILRTALTLKNPIPGANVMNHVDFAIHYGQDLAHGLSINAVRNLIQALDLEIEELERISLCGNPIHLSIFQGISIEDLAYAGERKKKKYNIQEQNRESSKAMAGQCNAWSKVDALDDRKVSVRQNWTVPE